MTKFINLYVQLPNETMSELVRDYPACLFDRSKFYKAKLDEKDSESAQRKGPPKAEEELNLQMNPTSLLEKGLRFKSDKVGRDSIMSSNRSGTADFLNHPKHKSLYGNAVNKSQ